MKAVLSSFVFGALFGVGISVGGMTLPSKAVGFLDFFGDWDPSLAFVMGGAVAVFALVYWRIRGWSTSVFGTPISLVSSRELPPRLFIGSALFGIGWGLTGMCPGPGWVMLGNGVGTAFTFVASMVGGMVLYRVYERVRSA